MAASPLPRLRLDSEARRGRIVDAALPRAPRTRETARPPGPWSALFSNLLPTRPALTGATQAFGGGIRGGARGRPGLLDPSPAGLVLMPYMRGPHFGRGDADARLNGDTR